MRSPTRTPTCCTAIAALLDGGMIEAEQLDEFVDDAITHLLRGSRVSA